jgi:antitoxin YefM
VEEAMTTLTVAQAMARLCGLLDEAAESHEPIRISGQRNNAVLVAEDDWRAIQETLCLVSLPGMRQSIRKGLKTSAPKCATRPGW